MQVPKAVAELAKYNEHIQAEHDGGTFVTQEARGPQAHPTQSHRMPVYLFLAEHDRIIDNEATIELLHSVLKGIDEISKPAKVYKGAHHTLDFEDEPGEFFGDLARVLERSD